MTEALKQGGDLQRRLRDLADTFSVGSESFLLCREAAVNLDAWANAFSDSVRQPTEAEERAAFLKWWEGQASWTGSPCAVAFAGWMARASGKSTLP